MFKHLTIRSITACFLLLVFSFGITPKLYLHDLVAGHSDTIAKTVQGHDTISKEGFNCHCDSQVATSPFVGEEEQQNDVVENEFISQESLLITFYLSCTNGFSSLRGPPAIG